ncbi:MAG: hypothetical protein IKO40_07605, partial [Kiritimatiellae bacterium]|nr:hypothetical protein [Kiritimatiellia bacterium]
MRSDWLFFTEDMAPEWNAKTGELLSKLLGVDVGITLHLPTKEKAQEAIQNNQTLTGSIDIQFGEADPVQLKEVLLPYYGIFVTHREDSKLPLIQVWNSWLGEDLGFRCTRPVSSGKRIADDHCRTSTTGQTNHCNTIREWRLGLPGGNYVKWQKRTTKQG